MSVTTSATPYCTARQLFSLVDYRVIADWSASGSGARPTRRALLDSTDVAGAVVANALLSASGELESIAVACGKYSPADLNSLTGATAVYLQAVVAGLTLWTLAKRRNPSSADPNKVPGAAVGMQALESLRLGERIFGLSDHVDAGVMEQTVFVSDDQSGGRVVNDAIRFFGNRFRGDY